jgi:hypothetical protein
MMLRGKVGRVTNSRLDQASMPGQSRDSAARTPLALDLGGGRRELLRLPVKPNRGAATPQLITKVQNRRGRDLGTAEERLLA